VDDSQEVWIKKLTSKVKLLSKQGYTSLEQVLPKCEGAQPYEVEAILKEILEGNPNVGDVVDVEYKPKFFFNIPAPNPLYYQWWYTLESQEKIAHRVYSEDDAAKVVCIGTPTVAAALRSWHFDVLLLDIDKDLVDAFKEVYADVENCSASVKYNVWDEPEVKHQGVFDFAVIDPPWYPEYFNYFFNRALHFLKPEGVILCSLPQILTRPGIEKERRSLIKSLLSAGHEIMFIEHGAVQYVVPIFEEVALNKRIDRFSNKPWRNSDLLAIRSGGHTQISLEFQSSLKEPDTEAFHRKNNRKIFRVFLRKPLIDIGIILKKLDSTSISRRKIDPDPDLWTSENDRYQLNKADYEFLREILLLWSDGSSKTDALGKLLQNSNEISKNAISNKFVEIERTLSLWETHSEGITRRSDEEIKESNEQANSKWASKASPREHQTSPDGFRIEFQRDRDRVIWSSGFRKLSNKTQLFPLDEDDFLRQRLAHSIEVMQLASTIASSFGLDKDLVDAGALAHDIGHTPFGHAGETALDQLLKILGVSCGFNHYEHGVDVVRYLEGPYQQSFHNSHPGLDLTREVCDCILKHTFCHSGGDLSHESIWRKSKHQNFLSSGFSSLEGQAVRAADKISYLLSDIEDGIRLGIVDIYDLLSCRLFNRPTIDFRMKEGSSIYLKFLEQRGSIIKFLMEDIIIESSKRLSKIRSIKDVPKAFDYCIFHSPQTTADINEIWEKIQSKKLHRDSRVLTANMNASKMVSELTLLFTIYDEFIEEDFRVEHGRLSNTSYATFYKEIIKTIDIEKSLLRFLPLDSMIGFKEGMRKNIGVMKLVLAKDYVASLTDKKITSLHKKLLGR